MFELIDYAIGRLLNTVLMYSGYPVYVLSVFNDRSLSVCSLETTGSEFREPFMISMDDDKLSFEPPTVGYINHDSIATYLYRNPSRRWKQGLSNSSLNLGGIGSDLFYSKSMVDCLQNKYPSLEECLKAIELKKVESIAFHRLLAITSNYSLRFRGTQIGTLSPEGLTLKRTYSMLERVLMQEIGHENL